MIVIDVSRNGNRSGNICWDLVGELLDMISGLSAYRDSLITVHHSLPSHAYLLLHFANIPICGRSTFCLMTTLGSQFKKCVIQRIQKALFNFSAALFQNCKE